MEEEDDVVVVVPPNANKAEADAARAAAAAAAQERAARRAFADKMAGIRTEGRGKVSAAVGGSPRVNPTREVQDGGLTRAVEESQPEEVVVVTPRGPGGGMAAFGTEGTSPSLLTRTPQMACPTPQPSYVFPSRPLVYPLCAPIRACAAHLRDGPLVASAGDGR